ncbi:DUF1826 domain-containing protein [Novosphingobium sp. BL-8A]|uniref:DUF1826 domain-containing protein n=1 Tax=Novosphingobium sp. BL-8A TaxID=3127639 RepID=UPI003757073C
MTVPPTLTHGVAMARGPDVLAEILDAPIHLALWQTRRPPELAWLDALDWDSLDDVAVAMDCDAPRDGWLEALTEAGYPAGVRTAILAGEIAALAIRFAAIMACRQVRIRLEVVETDACRKFHADHVTARLLTTLHGQGTQWIETICPDRIRQMEVGEVAIFKGRIWAEEPAVLHRSPPIGQTGETRLLLVIDPHPNDGGGA